MMATSPLQRQTGYFLQYIDQAHKQITLVSKEMEEQLDLPIIPMTLDLDGGRTISCEGGVINP